jgi:hypothetical protein
MRAVSAPIRVATQAVMKVLWFREDHAVRTAKWTEVDAQAASRDLGVSQSQLAVVTK